MLPYAKRCSPPSWSSSLTFAMDCIVAESNPAKTPSSTAEQDHSAALKQTLLTILRQVDEQAVCVFNAQDEARLGSPPLCDTLLRYCSYMSYLLSKHLPITDAKFAEETMRRLPQWDMGGSTTEGCWVDEIAVPLYNSGAALVNLAVTGPYDTPAAIKRAYQQSAAARERLAEARRHVNFGGVSSHKSFAAKLCAHGMPALNAVSAALKYIFALRSDAPQTAERKNGPLAKLAYLASSAATEAATAPALPFPTATSSGSKLWGLFGRAKDATIPDDKMWGLVAAFFLALSHKHAADYYYRLESVPDMSLVMGFAQSAQQNLEKAKPLLEALRNATSKACRATIVVGILGIELCDQLEGEFAAQIKKYDQENRLVHHAKAIAAQMLPAVIEEKVDEADRFNSVEGATSRKPCSIPVPEVEDPFAAVMCSADVAQRKWLAAVAAGERSQAATKRIRDVVVPHIRDVLVPALEDASRSLQEAGSMSWHSEASEILKRLWGNELVQKCQCNLSRNLETKLQDGVLALDQTLPLIASWHKLDRAVLARGSQAAKDAEKEVSVLRQAFSSLSAEIHTVSHVSAAQLGLDRTVPLPIPSCPDAQWLRTVLRRLDKAGEEERSAAAEEALLRDLTRELAALKKLLCSEDSLIATHAAEIESMRDGAMKLLQESQKALEQRRATWAQRPAWLTEMSLAAEKIALALEQLWSLTTKAADLQNGVRKEVLRLSSVASLTATKEVSPPEFDDTEEAPKNFKQRKTVDVMPARKEVPITQPVVAAVSKTRSKRPREEVLPVSDDPPPPPPTTTKTTKVRNRAGVQAPAVSQCVAPVDNKQPAAPVLSDKPSVSTSVTPAAKKGTKQRRGTKEVADSTVPSAATAPAQALSIASPSFSPRLSGRPSIARVSSTFADRLAAVEADNPIEPLATSKPDDEQPKKRSHRK